MSSRYQAPKYTWMPFDENWNRSVATLADYQVSSFGTYQHKYFRDQHFLNAEHQFEWARIIDGKEEYVLINEPRDSGKSVTWSIEFPTYKFIEDYNTAGLLLTASDALSKTFTRAIVSTMLKNQGLIDDFHTNWWFDMKQGREGWSAHEIFLKRTTTRREPSLKTAGIGTSIIGLHPEWQLLDDITQDESSGALRGDKLRDWVRKVIIPMEARYMYIIGTRKGPDDIYQFFRKMNIFRVSTRAALKRIPRYETNIGEDGKLLIVLLENLTQPQKEDLVYWKEKYTLEKLLEIREIIGAEAFSGEYQNDPLPSYGKTFLKEWLEYYNYEKFINSPEFLESTIYTVLDPGGSSEASDYNALCTAAFVGGKIYFLETKYGHWRPPETVQQIEQTYYRWKKYGKYPLVIGIESEFLQGMIIDLARAMGLVYLPFQPLYPGRTQGDKVSRIEGLVPYLANHQIHISEQALGEEEFIKEYLYFEPEKVQERSRAKDRVRWDVLDASQQTIQIGAGKQPAMLGVRYY